MGRTIKRWISNPINMVTIYIPIEGMIPVPELWTALTINPKTPIGANLIIKAVINMIESYKEYKIGSILFLRSLLNCVIDIPKINAKKIIDNISPFTIALNGFVGIIRYSISTKDEGAERTPCGLISLGKLSRLKYVPGLIKFVSNNPIVIANKDVLR